jgi:hypothetical protein
MADKFEELESRIMRTIELVKSVRQERDQAQKDLAAACKQVAALERDLEQLRRERDIVKKKVEALIEMLSELTEETLV